MDKVKGPVTISSEIMHGEPVFTGTRVPIKALFDYLEGGDPLEEFFEDFPTVAREAVQEVLKLAGDKYIEALHAS